MFLISDAVESFKKNKEISSVIKKALESENADLESFLNLTDNENILSETAKKVFLSDIGNRYHIGLPENHTSYLVQDGDFIFKGLPNVFQLENLAFHMFNKKTGASFSDFRLLSGVHANICTIVTTTGVNDTVLSIHPEDGGHFATSTMITRMGRKSRFVRFSRETFSISLSDLEKQVRKYKPKIFLMDHSATLFKFPVKEIRKIIGKECILIYDASHVLGLIYGRCFQDPLKEGCDILQGNTHKTFPGPQKAVISFASEQFGKEISGIISSGFVSSQHTHHSVALYISILEMYFYGETYAKKVIDNAKIFSNALIGNGFDLLSYNGITTDSHMFFVRIPNKISSLEACKILYETKISINAKKVFGEEFLRFGVQEITRMRLGKTEIERLAQIARFVLLEGCSSEKYAKEVAEIRKNFKEIGYSFDCKNKDGSALWST